MNDFPVDRRGAIATGAALAASLMIGAKPAEGHPVMMTTTTDPIERDVVLSVNGTDRIVRVDTRMALLDALREKLGLTGSKKGCDQGQCGACTIHIDGERHLERDELSLNRVGDSRIG